MKAFIVTARAASFGPGAILALSEDQYKRRAHNVRELDEDDERGATLLEGQRGVEVERQVQFKMGEEVLVISGDVNKRLFEVVAPADSPAAKDAQQQVGEKKATAAAARETQAAEDKKAEKQRVSTKKAGKKGKAKLKEKENEAVPASPAKDEPELVPDGVVDSDPATGDDAEPGLKV